jgi:Chlor_Arch_YYY domain
VINDLFLVVKWWAFIFLIGLIFLPVSGRIFRNFIDRGYLFSKVLGIAMVSFFVWFLSSLRIVPFTREAIFISYGAALLIIYAAFKGYKEIADFKKINIAAFILEELLFLGGLIFWAYIRGIQPDIYGLEKYMDFGFVNSILRTRYMPPLDIWFSGKSINYYYYGHYVCAFLTRLSGIKSSITYNIMLSTIFSLTFSLSFSLVMGIFYCCRKNSVKSAVIAGLISAMLITFGGNLHSFIYAWVLPAAKSINLYHGNIQSYFYPDATRYIGYNPPTNDKTIHEFPFYSFVVSDLHGHVSNIPFVLTFIALLFVYIKRNDNKLLFLLAFLLSILYMTSTWDFIIYITVALFAFLYKSWTVYGYKIKTVWKALLLFLEVFFLSQVLCLPYTINFKNMTGGVGIVSARTPLYQLLVLWGYQLFLTVCFVVFLWKRQSNIKLKRESGLALETADSSHTISDIFIVILLISAAGLVLIPEVVYVVDIYGSTYQRANTMFKLTYQSFIMFGAASGYIIVRIVTGLKNKVKKGAAAFIFALILIMPMSYPYFAVKGYYGSIRPNSYKGLDGLNFMDIRYHSDFMAIKWLMDNVKGQPVVLEASGDSYSDYERISMATGFPTVQGWFVHEWLWRGSPDAPSERAGEVQFIYESGDADMTSLYLEKYRVSYIVIGDLERQKYAKLNEGKLLSLGDVVFSSGSTKIIKVR